MKKFLITNFCCLMLTKGESIVEINSLRKKLCRLTIDQIKREIHAVKEAKGWYDDKYVRDAYGRKTAIKVINGEASIN